MFKIEREKSKKRKNFECFEERERKKKGLRKKEEKRLKGRKKSLESMNYVKMERKEERMKQWQQKKTETNG